MNLCRESVFPPSLPPALVDVTAVIGAATSRPTDSLTIKQVDWDGKVALIQTAKAADVVLSFLSILDAEKYPDVPLMEIKRCTSYWQFELHHLAAVRLYTD